MSLDLNKLKKKLNELIVESSNEDFLASINEDDLEYFSSVPPLGLFTKPLVNIKTEFGKLVRIHKKSLAAYNRFVKYYIHNKAKHRRCKQHWKEYCKLEGKSRALSAKFDASSRFRAAMKAIPKKSLTKNFEDDKISG